jgi:flagellar basal-body rod modification protein FlgD
MTTVGATSSSTVAAAIATGAVATKAPDNGLGQDAFLKLLVAQLKNQDPMNPVQGADFIAQTATFTQVEKLTEMARQNEQLILAQKISQASSLVSHSVSYVDSAGKEAEGVVESVTMGAAGPMLSIAGKPVPLSSVTEVRGVPAPVVAAATTGTGTSSTPAGSSTTPSATPAPSTTPSA